MITHNGIKVKILVDNEEVPEYSVEKDLEQGKVMCWIPSQVGKEFKIVITNGREERCRAVVKADGITATQPIFCPLDTKNVAFYRQTSTVVRPFVFVNLEIVDDDDLLDNLGSHLGEIELVFRNFESIKTDKDPNYNRTFPENKKVHERTKKGLGQHIGLGDATTVPAEFTAVKSTDHIVTFVLRYRPLDYLQAQGIAPLEVPQQVAPPTDDATLNEHRRQSEASAPDEPEPEIKVEVKQEATREEFAISEDTDDDDIKALLVKVEEMRAKKRKKKATRTPQKKMKKEEPLPGFLPGEVIDLT